MVASYGETSGFSALDTEELMLVNGGKGSTGGGSSGGGNSSTKNTSTKSTLPTTNPNINFKSAPSTQVYITDARAADAFNAQLAAASKNTTAQKVQTTAVKAIVVIASLVSPPLAATVLGLVTGDTKAH